MKEAIKKIMITGGFVCVNYKRGISNSYTELKLARIDDEYAIIPMWMKFSDLDEAINSFLDLGFTSKNFGLIQDRLFKKGIDFGDDDDVYEKPSKEMKKLFKDEGKLVDQEAKSFNIMIPPKLNEDKALKDFEDIINNKNHSNLVEDIKDWDKKYKRLDPYISFNIVANHPNGYNGEIRASHSLDIFSLELIDEVKEYKEHEYKYLEVVMSLDLHGDDNKFNRYKINI